MTESSEKKVKIKNKLSEWILDYDKNAYCDSKIDDETREILIDSFNECSDLRKSFHDSLNNFFNNLGFSSSMKNIHKFDNSFGSSDFFIQEKRKTFGNIGDFGLIKNNSVSKFGFTKKKKIKKKVKNDIKPITSIRKKMLTREELDDEEEEEEEEYINKKKKEKIEKDKYELDIINKMVYGDIEKKDYNEDQRIEIKEEILEENEESEEKRTIEKNKDISKNKSIKNKDKLINSIFDEMGNVKEKSIKENTNNELEQKETFKYKMYEKYEKSPKNNIFSIKKEKYFSTKKSNDNIDNKDNKYE